MAKKIKESTKNKNDIRTFPIAKSKSFLQNLNSFIKMIELKHKKLKSREFIREVHFFVDRYKSLLKNKAQSVGIAKQKIKICRQCEGWSQASTFVKCNLCQDNYHFNCLQNKQEFQKTKLCQNCKCQSDTLDKESYIAQLIEQTCSKCENQKQGKQSFVQCLKCLGRFHKKCYGKANVVCRQCSEVIQKQINNDKKLRQSTLLQYKSSTKKQQTQIIIVSESKNKIIKEEQGKLWEQSTTRPWKQKDLFNRNIQPLTKEQIIQYKKDMMYAIMAKNMTYRQQLVPIQCTLQTNNQESLDFGLDHMTPIQYKAYLAYKKQPIGPFKFQFKKGMGYDVKADKYIPQRAIICEYIGEVLQTISHNDSIMELRSGCFSDQTLIIRPQKYTNMARFINGINNSKSSSIPNVATVRKLAQGIPTVILYSIKQIKPGESLLYDYNAGSTTCMYDTSNFL